MVSQTDAVNRMRQGILAQRVMSIPENSLPGRWMLHAGPGWGKTSFGAKWPKPIFLQSRGETGLQTLIDYGQLPPTPYLPEAESWDQISMYVRALREEEHDYKTLVIDTINGTELLCRAHVIADDFNGSESDFQAFGKGAEMMATQWNNLLAALDRLRAERRMVILLLCHTTIKTFNNPTGSNYDRYTPEMSPKIFLPTYKWVDGALFGAFETQVIGRTSKKISANPEANADKKVKVSADVQSRILYTEETAAWSAKQRHGLPPEIECGESADDAYREFTRELKSGRDRMRAALAETSKQINPTQQGSPVGDAPTAAAQPAGSSNGSTGTGGVPSAGEGPLFAQNAQTVPQIVEAIWARMKNTDAIKDELASLRAALIELLGLEKGRVEYDRIAREFGGKDETNLGVCKRVAFELWKAVQELTEKAEAA